MSGHTPFNTIPNEGYCCETLNDPIVDKMIGNAYYVVKFVALRMTFIKNVSDNMTQLLAIHNKLTELSAIYTKLDELQLIHNNLDKLQELYNQLSKLTGLYDNLQALLRVYDNLTPINTVASNIDAVNTVATDIAKVIIVSAQIDKVITVANSITNVNTVAGSIDAVNTVSTNINTIKNVNTNMAALLDLDNHMTELLAVHARLGDLVTIAEQLDTIIADHEKYATAEGAGLIGFNQAQTYAANTVGAMLRQVITMGNDKGGYAVAGKLTSTGGVWSLATGSINMNAPTAGAVANLVLNYKAGKVSGLLVAPSQQMALDGLIMGASTTDNTATVSVTAPLRFKADLTAKAISGVNTRIMPSSAVTLNVDAYGGITLGYPPSLQTVEPVMTFITPTGKAPLTPRFSSVTAGAAVLVMVGEAEAQLKYSGGGWAAVSDWDSGTYCAFDTVSGELTVYHSTLIKDSTVTFSLLLPTDGTQLTAQLKSHTDSSFVLKIAKPDGSLLDAPLEGMGIMYSRGMHGIYKVPYGSLIVDVGRVQVKFSEFNTTEGISVVGINSNA
ncbi:lateral tail fiber proximal subunit [Escherichia phage AlfredRasser]|nr:lateral tail fiber proximal subunit [Escherichia phage AlfredRasser]